MISDLIKKIILEKLLFKQIGEYKELVEKLKNENLELKSKYENLLKECQQIAIDPLTNFISQNYYRFKEKDIIENLSKEHYLVILADLDNLKKINTKYGYKVGDLYIEEGARLFSYYVGILSKHGYSCLLNKNNCSLYKKFSSLLIRRGGDEFIALIPLRDLNYDLKDLNNILDYIQKNIENPKIFNEIEVGITLAYSILPKGTSLYEYQDLINKLSKELVRKKKLKKRN